MNKAQLIQELASRFDGNRKQAQAALDTVLETITRQIVKGERVVITGFGAFERVDRPARTARNPRTGERVKVKKTSVPKFKPGAELKSFVNGTKKLPKLVAGGSAAAAAAGTAKRTTRKAASGAAGATTAKSTGTRATSKRSAAATTGSSGTTRKTAAKGTTAKGTSAKRTATKRAAKA